MSRWKSCFVLALGLFALSIGTTRSEERIPPGPIEPPEDEIPVLSIQFARTQPGVVGAAYTVTQVTLTHAELDGPVSLSTQDARFGLNRNRVMVEGPDFAEPIYLGRFDLAELQAHAQDPAADLVVLEGTASFDLFVEGSEYLVAGFCRGSSRDWKLWAKILDRHTDQVLTFSRLIPDVKYSNFWNCLRAPAYPRAWEGDSHWGQAPTPSDSPVGLAPVR